MVKETQLLEIICTCRSIEDGNKVECGVCKKWFHQARVYNQKMFGTRLQHHGCVIHARINNGPQFTS